MIVNKDGEVDLKVAAARAGWWNLGQPELEALAGHLDIDLAGRYKMVDILQTMTKTVPGVDDNMAMDHWASRLDGNLAGDPEAMAVLHEVDEAAE